MKKLFIGIYNPSIILTYIGVFCSLIGIAFLFNSAQKELSDALSLPMIFLVIAGVCDLFDGRVARLCKRTEKEKKFGIELDSLADVVSFVILPASILLFSTSFNIFGIIVACFYVFCGIMRLSWFNITTEENKGIFRGFPVTGSALVFPLIYVLFKIFDFGGYDILQTIAFFLVGLSFVLNFKLNKPGLKASAFLGLLAIAIIVLLIVL